jgi:hypothetical protein
MRTAKCGRERPRSPASVFPQVRGSFRALRRSDAKQRQNRDSVSGYLLYQWDPSMTGAARSDLTPETVDELSGG